MIQSIASHYMNENILDYEADAKETNLGCMEVIAISFETDINKNLKPNQ